MKKLIIVIMLLLYVNVSVAAPSYFHVTSTGADTKTGATWATAMDMAAFDAELEDNAEAGDVFFIKGPSTFSLTEDLNSSAKDGTSLLPIKIIGVLAATSNEGAAVVASDYAYSTDRPLLDCDDGAAAEWDSTIGDYYVFRNIRVISDDSYGLQCGTYGIIENCLFTQTSGSQYEATNGGVGSRWISCEMTGSSGDGIHAGGSGIRIANCYIHDVVNGINGAAAYGTVLNTIIDTTTIGMDLVSNNSWTIYGNAFYACTTGIAATDSEGNLIVNNIFDECTKPGDWATANQAYNWWDYNSMDGDSGSVENVTVGENVIDVDIALDDPTGSPGDFTLDSTATAVEGVGLMPYISGQVDIGVAQVSYDKNIGVDQDDISAAGGTTTNIKSADKSGGKQ